VKDNGSGNYDSPCISARFVVFRVSRPHAAHTEPHVSVSGLTQM